MHVLHCIVQHVNKDIKITAPLSIIHFALR